MCYALLIFYMFYENLKICVVTRILQIGDIHSTSPYDSLENNMAQNLQCDLYINK